MLTFWRINCSACEFQMPFTQELYNKWSSDSLAVLTINVGDRASEVKDYVANHGITYPVLLDQQSKVAQAYGIVGVPTTYFIDGKGVLKAYQIGAFQSEDAMESAIKSVFSSITLSPKTETSPEIGKVAPDFTLETIDSQSISLNDFRGKTVLLNFWVSSCDACVSELPYLQTASDNRTDQQAVILAVNCGESSQTVHSIVDRVKLSFPVLLDPEGTVCTAYKRGAPTAFLIDSNGIIQAIKDDAFENPGEVESMLDSLQ
jgi:peroxiredoxin